MDMKMLELKPNRLLLEPNFDGYKLCLKDISVFSETLSTHVDRAICDNEQYSFLYSKLFMLQNHLIGEILEDDTELVYFIDTSWTIWKCFFDPVSKRCLKVNVFEIPRKQARLAGDYNTSLKLINSKYAAVSDGLGTLYVLDRRIDEELSSNWIVAFSTQLKNHMEDTQDHDYNFVIADGVFSSADSMIHVLLKGIKKCESKCVTVLYWLTLKLETEDNTWEYNSIREITVPGFVQYANIEQSTCKAVYIVSDSGSKFTFDSEKHVDETPPETEVEKSYTWSQTLSDITLKFNKDLDLVEKDEVTVSTQDTTIQVKIRDIIFLEGDLYGRINSSVTHWSLQGGSLDVTLEKSDSGLMWPELVIGDTKGNYLADPALVTVASERLAHLTSETQESPAPVAGTTFNSQEVEECDFETDKYNVFERLSVANHKVTHKANLGSHQVHLSVTMDQYLLPALGLRNDVDICLWQPIYENEQLSMEHIGTLLALGYIQASKQQMKYFTCSPDFSYSVISEYSRHIFIYCQKKGISSHNNLRNRVTGQRVNTLAQQIVFSIPTSDEILGIFASKTMLYVLGETFLSALKIA